MGSPAASTKCISIGATWDATGAASSPFPPANCSDYSNRRVYTYTFAGASLVGLHFKRLDTATNYDFVRIKNAAARFARGVQTAPRTWYRTPTRPWPSSTSRTPR